MCTAWWLPKITKNLPSFVIKTAKLSIPENVKLADPFFYNLGHIDALIDGEFFLKLLETDNIEIGDTNRHYKIQSSAG